MDKKERNHAEQNAQGHAESILELYQAFVALEDGSESVTVDGETFNETDAIIERVSEMPLSVEVRSAWHIPSEKENSGEFQILLSTGGPALRIVGELDENACPCGNFSLEHQDWGTPWTEYHPDVESREDWESALDWFVGTFYFGE